jgi:quercetin dioxygenase-like cupin family protein
MRVIDRKNHLTMEIRPAQTRPTLRASSNYFTGTVWQEPIVDAPSPARIKGFRVTFEPGARTAWHTHPLGQTLYVTSGVGRIQVEGEPVREIRQGDTVWIPPNVKHWHGAAPTEAMEHLAFQEAIDGFHADWHEHVRDDIYAAEPEV